MLFKGFSGQGKMELKNLIFYLYRKLFFAIKEWIFDAVKLLY